MTVTHTRIVDAVPYFSECPVENSVPFIFSRIFLYVARVTPKARMSKVTIMTSDCCSHVVGSDSYYYHCTYYSKR